MEQQAEGQCEDDPETQEHSGQVQKDITMMLTFCTGRQTLGTAWHGDYMV
jgi:hypothetical protein